MPGKSTNSPATGDRTNLLEKSTAPRKPSVCEVSGHALEYTHVSACCFQSAFWGVCVSASSRCSSQFGAPGRQAVCCFTGCVWFSYEAGRGVQMLFCEDPSVPMCPEPCCCCRLPPEQCDFHDLLSIFKFKKDGERGSCLLFFSLERGSSTPISGVTSHSRNFHEIAEQQADKLSCD